MGKSCDRLSPPPVKGMIDAYQLLTGQEATPPLITAPGEPTNLRVTPGNGSLSVTWGAPSFTGGAPVQGYGLAVFEDEDLVRVHDRRHALGDDDDGGVGGVRSERGA